MAVVVALGVHCTAEHFLYDQIVLGAAPCINRFLTRPDRFTVAKSFDKRKPARSGYQPLANQRPLSAAVPRPAKPGEGHEDKAEQIER